MRALIIIGLLLSSSLAFADFQMKTKSRYGTREIRIYKEAGKYVCKADGLPAFNLTTDPFKDFKLVSQKSIFEASGCRDLVTVTYKKTSLKGCLTDPEIQKITTKFNSLCRY
jgi:hypothetical protein